jgi:hypothetical protein
MLAGQPSPVSAPIDQLPTELTTAEWSALASLSYAVVVTLAEQLAPNFIAYLTHWHSQVRRSGSMHVRLDGCTGLCSVACTVGT